MRSHALHSTRSKQPPQPHSGTRKGERGELLLPNLDTHLCKSRVKPPMLLSGYSRFIFL